MLITKNISGRSYVAFGIILFVRCCHGMGDIKFPSDEEMLDLQGNLIIVSETPRATPTIGQPAIVQPPAQSPIFQPTIVRSPSVQPTFAQSPIVQSPQPIVQSIVPQRFGYAAPSYNFITEFAWNLFKASKVPNPYGNLALSPLLVELLLSEIESVAVGRTQEELAAVLKDASPQVLTKLITDMQLTAKHNKLNMASAIFSDINLSLNDSLVTRARSRNVAIIPLNFGDTKQSAIVANAWIANATDNNIKELFKPDQLVGQRVLLTNSLYFLGSWKYQFTETAVDKFEINPTASKSVTFMKQITELRGNSFALNSGLTGTWVEIPYQGNEFSMILIMPTIRHTLNEFILNMIPDDLENIIQTLNEPYKRNVNLKMPKFSIESTFSLVNSLLKLGIVNVFTINSQLPYMTNNHEALGINDILQKTIVQVDEKGTIAASVTSVSVVALSLTYARENLIFNADQPFLSVIVDKRNKIPLLISKIFDP